MTNLSSLRERVRNATEWRPVPGWPYEASDTGALRSVRTGKALAPGITHNGYERVTLQVAKVRKDVRVHRAIAEAYLGTIGPGLQVNHIDGNKRNNRPDNLEIVTCQQNVAHASRLGLMATGYRNGTHTHAHKVSRGQQCHLAKLTEEQVREIRAAHARGDDTAAGIARRYAISKSNACDIVHRRIWRHI